MGFNYYSWKIVIVYQITWWMKLSSHKIMNTSLLNFNMTKNNIASNIPNSEWQLNDEIGIKNVIVCKQSYNWLLSP